MSTRASVTSGDSANLPALVDLIVRAVTVITQEYDKVDAVVPSLQSTVSGPFDTPESMTPELTKAIQTIEAACAQLSFSVAPPGHIVLNKAYEYEEPACLQVVTEAKIADMLVDKPEGVHVDELAKKSGLDSGKLGRILRLLATRHCFNEVHPNVFSNNRLSIKLVSIDPVSSSVGHMTGEGLRSGSFLNDAIVHPVSGPSLAPSDAPFRHAYGTQIFDYYAMDKHMSERFNKAMIGLGQVTGKGMLAKAFDWGVLPEGAIICDVGGGNGHVTIHLIQKFPQLRVILQDRQHVLEDGKKLWMKECPCVVEQQHVKFVPLDFFKETPVFGCDFYYLRLILHDWMDAECIQILRNVKSAMKQSSRVLIHEFVLQHVTRQPEGDDAQVSQAPEPLLPNFGMGRVRLYQQDINMMCLVNSKERTLQEFIDLGSEAGLKFVKVWDAGEASLVEFCVA